MTVLRVHLRGLEPTPGRASPSDAAEDAERSIFGCCAEAAAVAEHLDAVISAVAGIALQHLPRGSLSETSLYGSSMPVTMFYDSATVGGGILKC